MNKNKGSESVCATPYLGIDLQVALPSHAGINGELGGFVYDDPSWLQAWSVGFYLQFFVLF